MLKDFYIRTLVIWPDLILVTKKYYCTKGRENLLLIPYKYSPTVGIIRGLDTWIGPRGGAFHFLIFQIPTSFPISPIHQ